MQRILSLETSTPVCSAALHENGKLIAVIEVHEEQSHASKLGLIVKNLLTLTGVSMDSVNAVAVTSGPGSYTGLRIGTSLAKGLCFSSGIPLVAVNALEIMAHRVIKNEHFVGLLYPLLDARRMEVYTAIFDAELNQLSEIKPLIIEAGSFQNELDSGLACFFGPGVDKCIGLIAHPNATFRLGVYPSAVELGELAAKKLSKGDTEDLMKFEPIYLKEFLIKKSTKIPGVLNK